MVPKGATTLDRFALALHLPAINLGRGSLAAADHRPSKLPSAGGTTARHRLSPVADMPALRRAAHPTLAGPTCLVDTVRPPWCYLDTEKLGARGEVMRRHDKALKVGLVAPARFTLRIQPPEAHGT